MTRKPSVWIFFDTQQFTASHLLLCDEKLVDKAPDLAHLGDVVETRVSAMVEKRSLQFDVVRIVTNDATHIENNARALRVIDNDCAVGPLVHDGNLVFFHQLDLHQPDILLLHERLVEKLRAFTCNLFDGHWAFLDPVSRCFYTHMSRKLYISRAADSQRPEKNGCNRGQRLAICKPRLHQRRAVLDVGGSKIRQLRRNDPQNGHRLPLRPRKQRAHRTAAHPRDGGRWQGPQCALRGRARPAAEGLIGCSKSSFDL